MDRRRFGTDRRMAAAGVAATPSVGARLRCRGDIHQILADGPIQDVSFEPRVFRAMIKDSAAIRIGGLLYGVTAMPQLLMVPGPWNGLTASLWGVCALFGAIYLLRPMYYRIVPGRLDVLRYSLLRRAPMRVERHDLRAAQVWIDMRTNLVSIIEGDKVSEYALWFMRERNAFARALFEGAISTHAAPATSDEVL